MEPFLKHNIQDALAARIGSRGRLGIWGAGIMGTGWARLLGQLGIPIILFDQRPLDAHDFSGLSVDIASHNQFPDFVSRCSTILVSAGIDTRPYYQHGYSVPLIGELDLVSTIHTIATIAITGSVGKTTIAQGIAHILARRGITAFLGGNVGVSLAELIQQQPAPEYLVCEVSSFQLDQVKTWAPRWALWSNFWPNHLDRHGTPEGYWQAKIGITKNQSSSDTLIISPQVAECAARYGLSTQAHVHIAPEYSGDDDTSLITYPENYSLWNQLIQTIWPEKPLNVSYDLQDFKPDRHRREIIAECNNILIINDSKSTIPAAALAALHAYHTARVIWIIGGVSKGVDRISWLKQLRQPHIDTVISFGSEAYQLAGAVTHQLVIACDTLEQACHTAWTRAQTYTDATVILFSPAGASFDLFANYQERGQVFTRIMQSLISQPRVPLDSSAQSLVASE